MNWFLQVDVAGEPFQLVASTSGRGYVAPVPFPTEDAAMEVGANLGKDWYAVQAEMSGLNHDPIVAEKT